MRLRRISQSIAIAIVATALLSIALPTHSSGQGGRAVVFTIPSVRATELDASVTMVGIECAVYSSQRMSREDRIASSLTSWPVQNRELQRTNVELRVAGAPGENPNFALATHWKCGLIMRRGENERWAAVAPDVQQPWARPNPGDVYELQGTF